MDYILQIEKLNKYLEFNLDIKDKILLKQLLVSFNNDLNLIGCFLKDFLTLENNGRITSDENIYNDFVLCFEKYKSKNKELHLLNKVLEYSEYYLTIVFEDTQDRVLLSTIASINSCFAMEYYPFMMELIGKKINTKIDDITYALMLQCISDAVFKNFQSQEQYSVNLLDLREKLEEYNSSKIERIAI